MSTRIIRLLSAAILLGLLAYSQRVPPELGQGWLAEFNLAAQHTAALADAIPAEKFGWRPAPGVRSVGEVYMHIAIGNYFLLGQAGVRVPQEIAAQIKPDTEKSVTAKPDIIKWLKDSQELVRTSYPKADLKKQVKFFGNDATADGVFLRILVHNHEHMGQSVAYARSIGVKPPWSE